MAEPQIAHDAAAAAADRQSDTASAPTPLPTLEGCRKGFLPEERVCLGTLARGRGRWREGGRGNVRAERVSDAQLYRRE